MLTLFPFYSLFLSVYTNTRCWNEWINISCKNGTLLVFPICSPTLSSFQTFLFSFVSLFVFFGCRCFLNPPSLSSPALFHLPSPPECQSWSGGAVHQAGANWQGFVWRGVQRHRQSDPESSRHQDHRPGGSGGWDRRHSAGDHGAEPVWQPLCDQVLRLIPEGDVCCTRLCHQTRL